MEGDIEDVVLGEERARDQQAEEEDRGWEEGVLTRIPRIFSSVATPSRVAHWKAETQESLISF